MWKKVEHYMVWITDNIPPTLTFEDIRKVSMHLFGYYFMPTVCCCHHSRHDQGKPFCEAVYNKFSVQIFFPAN